MKKNLIREQMNKPRIATLLAVGFLTVIPVRQTLADSWHNNRVDRASISAHYDPSVGNYGYTSMFDTAMSQWNNISTKVSVSRAFVLTSGVDRYYVGVTPTAELWGQFRRFITNANGVVVESLPGTEFDSLWHHTAISIYDNQHDASGFTTAERTNTITHEMGHTLKLTHVGDGTYHRKALPYGSRSVMERGTRQSFGPQQYDKDELRYKWGT